jgi:hypothetical protein
MTPSEAVFALSSLVAATPGWSDSTVEEYVAQLEPLTDPNALLRATHSIARAWTEMRRPPIATILESYDRECLLASNAIEPSRVHCDGSGWVPEEGEGLVPCRRCQPALARVWDDPDKLDRFRRGTAIQHLDVGVEAVHDRLRYTDGHRCAIRSPTAQRTTPRWKVGSTSLGAPTPPRPRRMVGPHRAATSTNSPEGSTDETNTRTTGRRSV